MLGNEIKEKRLALDLTQSQLADIFGITSTTLARWERDEIAPAGSGMLALAFETLESRQMLSNPEFIKRKEQIQSRISDSLTRARKRVKHPRPEVV
jgi:transcriptional regulator with XRE-family HTH domain